MSSNNFNLRPLLFAATAAFTLNAAPASAKSFDLDLEFDDHKDLLVHLIALDADDIEDLRNDLQEAQTDIANAIIEVTEAKEEIKEAAFGGIVERIAFAAAKSSISEVADEIFADLRANLTLAKTELGNRRSSIGEDEFVETSGLITMLEGELTSLEASLKELAKAFD